MSNKKIKVLNRLLAEIEQYIPLKDKTNKKVTTSDIAWQLDHSLKVFNAVCISTINSNPKDYAWKPNFWRAILFPLGHIPRGKVKAPKIVQPPHIILEEDLYAQLELANKHLAALKGLSQRSYFKHFVFGKLSKKQTLKFLAMHTNHHLKIVRDILNT